MSANPNVPVLFYSERCANSKEVVQTIQALNKASLFRFVCIDTTPRNYIPPEVKAVPTVINPQTKEVITGKAAIFARISKPVESRREVPQTKAALPSQPTEWSFNDVQSMSSTYSFLDEKAKQPDDQLNYSFLDGTIKTSGQDLVTGGGDAGARLEQMEQSRNAEFKASSRQ
jgi:hypothetical protein